MTTTDKEAIVTKAREAIADINGYDIYRTFDLSFEDLSAGPEKVMVSYNLKALGIPPRPTRRGNETLTKEQYRALHAQWRQDGIARAEVVFKQVLARFGKAGIRYRTGTDAGWPVARLA